MPSHTDTQTLCLPSRQLNHTKDITMQTYLSVSGFVCLFVCPSIQDKKKTRVSATSECSHPQPCFLLLDVGWRKPERTRVAKWTHCFENCHCVLLEPCWVDNFIIQNGLKEVVLVLCLEGCMATQHLIQQHAHGPPVYVRSIQHLLQDLKKRWGRNINPKAS